MNPSALQQATQQAQAPQGMPTPQAPQQGTGGVNPQMAQALQALMGSQGGQPGQPQIPGQQTGQPQPQTPQEPQFKDPNQQGGMSAELLMQLMQNPQMLQQLIHMGVFTMANGRLMLNGMQAGANQAQEQAPTPQAQASTPDMIQSFQQAPQQSSMAYPGVNVA